MEFLIFCRVCLQESEGMQTIFNHDSDDLMIYEKIMLCSTVKIQPEENLPDNICNRCISELETAYKFRIKIEDSDKILHSFLLGNHVNGNNPVDQQITNTTTTNIVELDMIKKEEIFSNAEYIDSIVEFDEDYQANSINNTDYVGDVVSEGAGDVGDDDNADGDADIDSLLNPDISDSIGVEKIELNSQSPPSIMENHENEYYDENASEYEIFSITDADDTTNINNAMDGHNKKISNNSIYLDGKSDIKLFHPIAKAYTKKRTNDDNSTDRHSCHICGNKYKFNHSLQTHLRRHRNERPYPCELCGKAFVLNVELKTHMRTHTGLKPYSCRYCDRRFSDFGSRVKHERTHTGERPYVCSECGKAFAYSYGLSGHMLIHTGEKPFGCEKCGKHFNKKHHLKNHLQTHMKNENKANYPNTIKSMSNMKSETNDDKITLQMFSNNSSGQMLEEIIEEAVSEEECNDLKFYILNEDENLLNDENS